MDRSEKWEGGFISRDAQGRPTYWIRRAVGGVRFEVSTRCRTEAAAHRELVRFETDPAGYRAGGVRDRLLLDDDLAIEFLAAQAARGISRKHLGDCKRYVTWWRGELRGVDLRRANLARDILPALARAPGARHLRIAVLKRLYGWLREQDRIATADDPTLGKLKMPKTRPAQWGKSKVIPADHYEKARKVIVPIVYRDALDVLAGTGWHLTELGRFAAGGTVEVYRGDDPAVAAVLVCPLHKSGAPHRTPVGEEVAGAGRRLLAAGGFSASRFHRAVVSACKAAGVPPFRPGWFRHTIATLATEAGAADLAPAFLGHKSASTTRRFYAVRAVPPKVPTLR